MGNGRPYSSMVAIRGVELLGKTPLLALTDILQLYQTEPTPVSLARIPAFSVTERKMTLLKDFTDFH